MLLATLVWVLGLGISKYKKKISFWVWIEYKFKKIRKKTILILKYSAGKQKINIKCIFYKFSVF